MNGTERKKTKRRISSKCKLFMFAIHFEHIFVFQTDNFRGFFDEASCAPFALRIAYIFLLIIWSYISWFYSTTCNFSIKMNPTPRHTPNNKEWKTVHSIFLITYQKEEENEKKKFSLSTNPIPFLYQSKT